MTYLKGIITIEYFSARYWRVSSVVSKIITSVDGLLKMGILVFPKGEFKSDENYVGVRAQLLSSPKHCYASSLKFSIRSPSQELKNEKVWHCYWQEYYIKCGISRFIARKKCSNLSENILSGDKLTILAEVFCMCSFTQMSNYPIFESTINETSIEMSYDWTICDLLNFPNVPSVRIVSPLFPSRDYLAKFNLQMAPRGENGSSKGYVSLFNCVEGITTTGPSLTVNFSFTVRNFGRDNKTISFGPFSYFFDVTTYLCYGVFDALLYEQLISMPCLSIEYQGIYNLKPKRN